MLGVSHGALQFMTYEEMKNAYNEYRKLPIDTKLVSLIAFRCWDKMPRDAISGVCLGTALSQEDISSIMRLWRLLCDDISGLEMIV